ncbi:hypothetical protein FSARC_1313 [Fusarium sarcochroum]|uniref:Uncharacterized protein n=1 Tax=Fusarium sarcochroum TaxID=1208366 RepID=A0A8H4U915_9HYPO|nr:hypothetical protein FSARC_1313 [Fusarium sarcochroum]
MCKKIVTTCCHCGELLNPYYITCNNYIVFSQISLKDNQPQAMPNPAQCEFRQQEIRPMLSGCPNIDACPSWFGSFFWGYGDAENEGPEIKSFREQVAQDKYKEWEEDFARKYFAKQPIPPRKEAESFWMLAQRDFFSDSEPSSMQSSEAELQTSEDEPLTAVNQDVQAQCDEVHGDNVAEDGPASTESSDVDPEDLFYGDVINEEDNSDHEFESNAASGTKSIGEEYQDLVAPIWTWFYPVMDMGRDGEFCD